MITFAYFPIGSTAAIPLPLLDSDRFWPARIEVSGIGEVQSINPMRAIDGVEIGRGLRRATISFTVTRQHVNIFEANKWVSSEITKLPGCRGSLRINYPGGGQQTSIGCVCLQAGGYTMGVASFSTYQFRGPKFTP